MKNIFLIALALQSFVVFGKNRSTEFTGVRESTDNLSVKDLSRRFQLKGEIFYFSPEGRLLNQTGEWREWENNNNQLDLVSHWRFESNRLKTPIALEQKWSFDKKGRLVAEISQYKDMTRSGRKKVNTGDLIRKKKFVLENFDAINWVAAEDSKGKVVVRLIPSLREEKPFKQFKDYPLVLEEAYLFDNKGQLWADHLNLMGQYIQVTTHKGALALSLTPFKGGKKMGVVEGRVVTVDLNSKDSVEIRSTNPIVPKGIQSHVYGMYRPQKRSHGIGSVHSSTSDKESEFLEHL